MQQLSLKLRRSTLILLAWWGLVAWSTGRVTAQGAKVWLDPATLELAPGEEGMLHVRVENVAQLVGAEVHLTFDPVLLEVVDADPASEGAQVSHGDFLSPDFVVQNVADPAAGTVDYAIVCIPVSKAVSGSGVLTHVAFRALAEGETRVTIRSALLADAQSQPIAVEIDSSVVAISRPGPSSAVWVLIGLVAASVVTGLIVVVWHAVKTR